jgi:hypothetical protein
MRHALCPACRLLLDLRDEWLGGKVECGGCGTVFAPPARCPPAVAWDDRQAGRPRYRNGRRLRPLPEPPDDTDGTTMHRQQKGQGQAVTALVLGIVALVVGLPASLCFCPIIMTVPSVLALLFGFLGLRTEGRSMALAGLVMGAIGQVLAGAFLLFYGSLMSNMMAKLAPPPFVAPAGPPVAAPGFNGPPPGGVQKR